MIIGLYAGGMTAREIRHHTGGSTIGAGPGAGGRSRRSPTRCAGAVMEWQRRPLEAFYPVIYLDAIRVKVRADHRVPGTPEPASPWARGMDGVKHVA